MALESVGSVLNTNTDLQQASIGQDDLFKILLTQLNYQDPLKPLDNQEFIARLAQFTDLEQSRQINDRMEALLTMQSANQSIGLLGHTVQVNSAAGTVSGNVTTVAFQQGVPVLTVLTTSGSILPDVSLSQISVVR